MAKSFSFFSNPEKSVKIIFVFEFSGISLISFLRTESEEHCKIEIINVKNIVKIIF